MLIIDKNKDYYDYFSHIYGVDKKVVYDRRGSERITDIEFKGWVQSPHSMRYTKHVYIVLETGLIQYLIKVFDFKYRKKELDNQYDFLVAYKMEIVREFKDNKHYYKTPISLRKVSLQRCWDWRKDGFGFIENTKDSFKEIINSEGKGFENPILCNTKITSLIDPFTVWKDVQTYISGLNNDKDIDLEMTEKEKAETHGFDKNSFRNPIK